MKEIKILLVSAIIILAGSFGFAQVTIQNSGTQDLLRSIVNVPGDANQLWLCATQKVLHSTNAGENWETFVLDFTDIPEPGDNNSLSNKIYCGAFHDAYNGMFGGDRSLFKYDNGVFINLSEEIGFLNITSINYLSANKIIISGYDIYGKILLSEDGGDSWDIIFTFPSRSYLLGGDFYGESGIIVGSRKVGTGFLGLSIQTTDGGDSWNTTYLSSGQLRHVEMINENVAIASANSGIVPLVKTTNSGNSWNNLPAYGGVIGLNVTSENEIFTTHNNWQVTTSVDSGNNWEVIFGPDNTDQNILFYDIYMNDDYVWATGWYGTILRWDVPSYKSMMYGSAMNIQDINNSNINIYPNPAIDMININEDISDIKIYDITGKVVFESNKNETTKSIDISSFKQGTYIVSMNKNSEITKEMLIKK